MGARINLHALLVAILGSQNVYFQPPATIQMNYPCIIYQRSDLASKHADDSVYNAIIGYTVTVIDSNPDSLIPGKMNMLSNCKFDRHYRSDNLNHDVYTLFY